MHFHFQIKLTQNQSHHYMSYSLQTNKNTDSVEAELPLTFLPLKKIIFFQLPPRIFPQPLPDMEGYLQETSLKFSSSGKTSAVGRIYVLTCIILPPQKSSSPPGPLPGSSCHSSVSTFIRPWISLQTEAVFLLKSLWFQNALILLWMVSKTFDVFFC